jgi:hypothetical protein
MGRWIAWLLAGRPLDDGIGGAPRAVQRRAPRGLLLYVAAGSLFVTGVVAIGAVTQGSLRTDHLRVLATSLGFAVFSATAAAGAAARREGRTMSAVLVGAGTVVLSAISLITLLQAVWHLDVNGARSFGSAALLTLAGSHASIVLRARRAADGPTVRFLAGTSILLATLDCGAGALLIQGNLRIHDYEGFARAAAAIVIAMLVTTALQPILRAAERARAGVGRGAAGAPLPPPPPPPAAAFPPPPPAAAAAGGRLTPAVACGIAVMVGLGGYLLGNGTRRVERVSYPAYLPAPAAAPPTAPTAYVPPPKPTGSLADSTVLPRAPFPCTPVGERKPEVRHEASGFARTEVRRGSRGLCVTIAGEPMRAFSRTRASARSISIAFFPAGSAGRRAKAFRLVIAPAPDGNGAFRVTYEPPGNPYAPPDSVPTSAGYLGMSKRRLSVLVDQPLLPEWVTARRTTWTVSVN